jgi:hypothetical protein
MDVPPPTASRRAGAIGPLSVVVRGDRPLVDAIARELSPVSAEADPAAAIDLDISVGPWRDVGASYRPTTFSAKTHMSFTDRAFSADEPVRFALWDLFSETETCRLAFDDMTEPRVAYLRRRFGRTIDAHPSLSYALLWFVVHVRLLRRGVTSVHAGIAELETGAVAIAGTGGSGKTSLLFSLLERDGARYLAEDFGILASDGAVHLSPKAISIYSSDLHSGSIGLSRYVASRPVPQRAKWLVHRRLLRTTPMVKAPVGAILPPERIGTHAPLRQVLWLIRTAGSGIRARDASADELAERATNVAWREHKRLLELVRMIRANAADSTQVPTVESLTAETRSTLRAGLVEAERQVVEVPAAAGPDEILDALGRDGILR